MPKYSDNNIFNIEDNKYIFYYYYNKSRNVNILDTNKISEIDKNKIIEEFTKVKNNSFISFDINYDENNKSSYYIYFNIFNNKTYGFIRNKSNNDWKYLVCNKIVNVKCVKIESESKTNLIFNCQIKKFNDLVISDTFSFTSGKKSIHINNNNWLYDLYKYLEKQEDLNVRGLHIELSKVTNQVQEIYKNISNYKITKKYLLDKNNWNLIGKNNSAYALMLNNLLNNIEGKHMTFLYNNNGISEKSITDLHTNINNFFK